MVFFPFWAWVWKVHKVAPYSTTVSKHVEEVISSRKKTLSSHLLAFFNNLPIKRESSQKHLGLFLDERLPFLEHIHEKIKKITKSINLLRKLNLILPGSSLSIIYKSFVNLI